MSPRLLTALFLAGVLALAGIAVGLSGRGGADGADQVRAPGVVSSAAGARFQGAVMPRGVRAPAFSLRDERGRPVSMRAFRGRPLIVTFLYTRCEETCPAEAQQIRIAQDRLGRRVPALAVSVDPAHDTPASARHFNAEQGVEGRLRWALGSRDELRRVWRGFAIQPQGGGMEHQARIVLVDRRGLQRIGFPASETTPERIAHDLRLLAAEPGAVGSPAG